MRIATIAGCLALLAAPVLAQEAAQGGADGPLRIGLRLDTSVDGEAEKVNGFQYYVWLKLHQAGCRVDSLVSTRNSRQDDYIAKQAQRWAANDPAEGGPPADLIVEGNASCDYDNSEFFGQGQAHNYWGSLHVEVKQPEGETIAVFDWDHSWGRLPTNYTRSQVLREYGDMLFTSLIIGLLSLDEIQARIPADERAKTLEWIEEERQRVLEPLGENMSECDIAVFLRSLGEEGEGEGGDDGGE